MHIFVYIPIVVALTVAATLYRAELANFARGLLARFKK